MVYLPNVRFSASHSGCHRSIISGFDGLRYRFFLLKLSADAGEDADQEDGQQAPAVEGIGYDVQEGEAGAEWGGVLQEMAQHARGHQRSLISGARSLKQWLN